MNSLRAFIEYFAPGENSSFYSVMTFFFIGSGFEQICAYLYCKLMSNEYFKHQKQMSQKEKESLMEEGRLVDAYNPNSEEIE